MRYKGRCYDKLWKDRGDFFQPTRLSLAELHTVKKKFLNGSARLSNLITGSLSRL